MENDRVSRIENREKELVSIIEALVEIRNTHSWKVLKSYVFDGVLETLERRLAEEAKKDEISSPELYRLQGQIVWARKYADLNKLEEIFQTELTGIKKLLHGKK